MYRVLMITIVVLFTNLALKAQGIFIIGERSYPSTDMMTFESEAENGYDLDICIAKEGEFGYFAVSSKNSESGKKFTGQLRIYLANGSVINCYENELSANVDDRAKALYLLTADQLDKIKTNNIDKVKYTMIHNEEELFTAFNTGVQTNVLINKLFDPQESDSSEQFVISLNDTNDLEASKEEPFAYVEQMPSFPDGADAMYTYIYRTLEYPAVAKANRISGQVIVQFVVSADGEVQNAKVIRGIEGGCNEEALRIVNNMPKWNPGIHNGRSVPVTFTLPIKFVF